MITEHFKHQIFFADVGDKSYVYTDATFDRSRHIDMASILEWSSFKLLSISIYLYIFEDVTTSHRLWLKKLSQIKMCVFLYVLSQYRF